MQIILNHPYFTTIPMRRAIKSLQRRRKNVVMWPIVCSWTLLTWLFLLVEKLSYFSKIFELKLLTFACIANFIGCFFLSCQQLLNTLSITSHGVFKISFQIFLLIKQKWTCLYREQRTIWFRLSWNVSANCRKYSQYHITLNRQLCGDI